MPAPTVWRQIGPRVRTVRFQTSQPAGSMLDAEQSTGEQAARVNLSCWSTCTPLSWSAGAAAAGCVLHQATRHKQCTHLPVLRLQLLQVDGVRVQVSWGRQHDGQYPWVLHLGGQAFDEGVRYGGGGARALVAAAARALNVALYGHPAH